MAPAIQSNNQPAATGLQPKPWVIWMLFGLGWVSLLMFGLSIIPAFHPAVKWSLYMMGWAFVACWWGGTAMGNSHKSIHKVKQAWTSCFIMACIGTAIGAVPSVAAFIYRSWYVIQSVVVAGLVFLALNAYSDQNKPAAEQTGEQGSAVEGAGESTAAAAADAKPAAAVAATESKAAAAAVAVDSKATAPATAVPTETAGDSYATADSQSYATADTQ